MSQTVVIAGALVFLFLVYVTSKGQLPAYLQILGVNQSPNAANKTGGISGPLSTPSTPLKPLSPLEGFLSGFTTLNSGA